MLGFGIPAAVAVADPGIASAAGVCQAYTHNIGSPGYNLGPVATESTGCGTTRNYSNNVYGYDAAASQYVNGSYSNGLGAWTEGSRGSVYMDKNLGASRRTELISGMGVGVDVRLHGSVAGNLSMQY
jgi:hypothetical protein